VVMLPLGLLPHSQVKDYNDHQTVIAQLRGL
jgi:hypothetical protein